METGKEKLECDFITCPECHVESKAEDWKECEPYCEDCGSHDGLECPHCGEQFDHVWGFEKLVIRKT